MRSTIFSRSAIAAGLLTIASATAGAQTWTAMPVSPNGGGTAFWNYPSQDNVSGGPCNAGAVLTGVATNAGCASENPSNLLPLAVNPVPNSYLGSGSNMMGAGPAFYFAAGSYRLDNLGTITGATPPSTWQFRDYITNAVLGSSPAVGGSTTFYAANGFYLTLDLWAPTGLVASSINLAPTGGRTQFAAFTNGTPAVGPGGALSSTVGNRYYVGFEDNACLNNPQASPEENARLCPHGAPNGGAVPAYVASDYDYNDLFIQVTAVPEPSSVVLMGLGLAGLAAAYRRRRQA